MRILTLKQISLINAPEVGGKAANLGELLHAGFRVPPGLVVTAGNNNKPLSSELANQALKLFDTLKLDKVAVRSSAIGEDSHEQSWAGQFATLLNVKRGGLIEAIETCRQSAKSAHVSSYGKAGGLGVVVQEMIDGDISGVAFSANPVSGNTQQIMIEAVQGLCEPLVQGTVTPDSYVVNKQTGELIASDEQVDGIIKPALLAEITDLVKAVEKHYGYAVDIEWSQKDGKLYLLQARPITTL